MTRPTSAPAPTSAAPSATAPTDQVLKGAALMIGFCILAPLLDVSAKLATATIPVGQVTLARFVVQAAVMLPLALATGAVWRMPARVALMVAFRAGLLVASTFCFIAGIAVMPIADALAIVFVEPFILLFLGRLLFGDQVGPRRIAASVVGFAGALMVIRPAFEVFGLVVLYPLGTAFLFAFYMLVTRAMASAMEPVAMQLHTALAGMVICLPVILWADGTGIAALDPVMPQGWAWVWLFGVGFWAAVSHMCMTWALRLAPAATLAPLHYTEIIMAVGLGWAVFGDFPTLWTWAGIAVITASGLYVIWREQRVARGVARADAAGALTDPGFQP